MKTIYRGKVTSLFVGLLFGPIGIGLFFLSFLDFLYTLLICLGFIYLASGQRSAQSGIFFICLVFCALWASFRAEGK